VAKEGDTRLVQGLYQASGFLTGKAFWFAALAALAVGLAAWRVLLAWYAWASLAAALLCALGGVAVKQSGFFGPMGGMTFIAFLALLVWSLATSLVVWRMAVGEEWRAPAVMPLAVRTGPVRCLAPDMSCRRLGCGA
jgi:hypothetical protein